MTSSGLQDGASLTGSQRQILLSLSLSVLMATHSVRKRIRQVTTSDNVQSVAAQYTGQQNGYIRVSVNHQLLNTCTAQLYCIWSYPLSSPLKAESLHNDTPYEVSNDAHFIKTFFILLNKWRPRSGAGWLHHTFRKACHLNHVSTPV